jgi:prepilin-type N-terminal cleavage/methylation domain-containing protein
MSTRVTRGEWCARARRRLQGERGFTLIEMLVALAAGIIVTTAMGAMVVTSVHFGSSTSDRIDANQQGRVAMEKITQALYSACVSSQAAPVISNGATGPVGNPAVSDGTHLWFYSAIPPSSAAAGSTGPTGSIVGDGANINPYLVEIYLSNGALLETAYPWASGTAPAPANTNPWSFNWTKPYSFTLLAHVAQSVNSVNQPQPIFQYFGYTSPVGTLSTTPYSVSPSLGATDSSTTAEVSVSFRALPSDNWNANNRGSDLTDAVVLRLTPASSDANASNAPCS